MSGVDYWLNKQDFQLFPRPPSHDLQWSDNPQWCPVASRLIIWGEQFLRLLAENPTPETIRIVREQLGQRYWGLYHRAPDSHRKDASSADHPCLHRAYLELWEKLEDVGAAAAIARTLPSSTTAEPEVIEGELIEEPFDIRPGILSEEEW